MTRSRTWAVVAVLLLVAAATACKRAPKQRDITTLPHVERRMGRIEPGSVSWVGKVQFDAVRTCYDDALQKDPGLAGTITVTAFRGDESPFAIVESTQQGTLTVDVLQCIERALGAGTPMAPGERHSAVLTLSSEIRRVPAPPGDSAYRQSAERMIAAAPVRILTFGTAHNVPSPSELSAVCKALVEFTADGIDHWCGELRQPGPNCNHHSKCDDCVAVPRKRGDRVALSGTLWFRLTPEGWSSPDDRHYFGDVPKEE